MLIGHQTIKRYFDQARENASLAQAYCLVGPSQVGKRTLAYYVAADLLQTSFDKVHTNPDFYFVEREVDPKTGKRKKDISVAQARDLRSRCQRRSWSGGYQVVVVDEVELLNAEAGNALLKILEESPVKTVVFLLTENDDVLLPTIKSRCQLFYIPLVTNEVLAAGLQAAGAYTETAVQQAVGLATGRPGRAILALTDEEWLARYEDEKKRWHSLLSVPFFQKISATEEWFKEGAGIERDALDEILSWWVEWWHGALLETVRGGARSVGSPVVSPERAQVVIDALQRCRGFLRQNVNARLALENVFLLF